MAVLYEQDAEAGTANAGVATSVFDYTQDGQTPYSRPFYRDDTPVPNSGRSKYFRIDIPGYEGTSTATGLNSLTDSSASGTGTGTISSSGTTVTGSGTAFLTELHIGANITADGETRIIHAIHSNTSLTVSAAWTAPLSADTFTYSWQTNKWGTAQSPDEPYELIDSAGTRHNISSNTGTVLALSSGLTPASGAYQIVGHHSAYNVHDVTQINLTPGTTYYLGAFFRFDRINGRDVWLDTSGPDSYDKLLEVDGNIRWIILAGWPNAGYSGSYDGQFTFDLYSSPTFCTSCGANEKVANVSPYGSSNPYLCDYGRWYAVVMAYKPSTGGAATDGLVELFINGTKTTSLAQKTQDSATPFANSFRYSGTIAQPAYITPRHYRKFDNVIFASALADIEAAGLMEDPEAAAATDLNILSRVTERVFR